MSKHIPLAGLLLAVLLSPLATRAATPEDEAAFTAAAQKAFDAHKPDGLNDLTCWDGTTDKQKKAAQQVYQSLMDEKDVTFTASLKPLEEHALDKELVQDGERCAWNLKPVKQLALTMTAKDKRILGIITLAVGEKDGKLRLSALKPVK